MFEIVRVKCIENIVEKKEEQFLITKTNVQMF